MCKAGTIIIFIMAVVCAYICVYIHGLLISLIMCVPCRVCVGVGGGGVGVILIRIYLIYFSQHLRVPRTVLKQIPVNMPDPDRLGSIEQKQAG